MNDEQRAMLDNLKGANDQDLHSRLNMLESAFFAYLGKQMDTEASGIVQGVSSAGLSRTTVNGMVLEESINNADAQWINWWLSLTLADDNVTRIYCQAMKTIGGVKYLYVGGLFTRLGGVDLSNVARYNFDTRQWEAVASSTLSGAVWCMAFDSSDVLHIGGFFTNAGGDANADYIAKLSGGNWVNVNGGVNASVVAMAFSPSNVLYIGGSFTDAGGVAAADYIAKNNAGAWASVNGGVNASITAINFDANGVLYIGGNFTNAGGDANADYIAKDNAGAWASVNGGVSSNVAVIVFDNTNVLYIGGSFIEASGDTLANYIAKDGGSGTWVNVNGGINTALKAAAFGSDNRLYIGGNFTDAGGDVNADSIAYSDGFAWQSLTNGGGISGLSGFVYSIVVDKGTDSVFAGGDFDTAGSIKCASLACFVRPLADAIDIIAGLFEQYQSRGDAKYAATSNGVTNGDSHNHSGGDGGTINHAALSNIGTNTHATIDTHLASTSNPHSTTAAQVGALGYALHVLALDQATTTDSQTIYWGSTPAAPSTSAAIARIYIPKAGTIKSAYIFTRATTAGTGENWSMYIRLNNTTDTLIETEATAANVRIFQNAALNIAVSAGDYIEIKEVHPAWATNPANIIRGGYIYIEP